MSQNQPQPFDAAQGFTQLSSTLNAIQAEIKKMQEQMRRIEVSIGEIHGEVRTNRGDIRDLRREFAGFRDPHFIVVDSSAVAAHVTNAMRLADQTETSRGGLFHAAFVHKEPLPSHCDSGRRAAPPS